jgi:7,8-dihydropterin-6-yl-methyl-4-(beta-D-ribofuranosyl)aminobenzene 5'-phosphate synthase
MKITTLVENDLGPGPEELEKEFGLSLLIEHAGQRILFDAGAAGAAVRNASRLGIDLRQVDAVVLSHHHFDHGGGLPAFLAINARAKVYLRPPPTGEPYFRALWVVSRHVGLEEGLVERFRDRFVFVDAFTEILPGVHIVTDLAHRHELPKGDRHLYLKQADGYVRDPFTHELVMVVRDDDGLVAFTGCGHSGVLNMIEAVTTSFPGERIKAVVGGFHLIGMPAPETMAGSRDEMIALAQQLRALPVDAYWTAHCTGHKAFGILQQGLGSRLGTFHTGSALAI